MSQEYLLKVPFVTNFEVKYYFSVQEKVFTARQYPTHMHDVIEVYVLMEGDASFMVENNIYRLQSGDMILTKPNEIHNCILNSDSLHNHICFWIDASVGELYPELLRHDFGKGNLISPTDKDRERLLALYGCLQAATQAEDKRREFYLILELLDILSKNTENTQAPQEIPDELKLILDDINRNFLSIHSLEYFTERFFVSQSTLSRLFRTYLHTTPGQYLEAKRLAHSRMLLRKGKSVLAACMESGFSNSSNYIRLFKKRFGITPGEYADS